MYKGDDKIMTIEEMYKEINGDYEDVLNRLRKPELVEKFVKKFLDDPSFSQLQKAVNDQNLEEAFRAVHTLKGVCLNLSFTTTFDTANELTELLRPGKETPSMEQVIDLTNKLEEQYKNVIAGIKGLA